MYSGFLVLKNEEIIESDSLEETCKIIRSKRQGRGRLASAFNSSLGKSYCKVNISEF